MYCSHCDHQRRPCCQAQASETADHPLLTGTFFPLGSRTPLCWLSSFLYFFHSLSFDQLVVTGRSAQGGILGSLSFSVLPLFLDDHMPLVAIINIMMMAFKFTSLVKCFLDMKSIIPTAFWTTSLGYPTVLNTQQNIPRYLPPKRIIPHLRKQWAIHQSPKLKYSLQHLPSPTHCHISSLLVSLNPAFYIPFDV